MKTYIYSFEEASKLKMTFREKKGLLGGKGAALADMTSLELPVPAGFIITTQTCHDYLAGKTYPEGFWDQFKKQLSGLEKKIGKKFGDEKNPLLVSVRSGAKISMPGMMDTILNLGINDTTIRGILKKTDNERFCYDAYRRFVNMFGNVVLGIKHEEFEHELNKIKTEKGIKLDVELDTHDLKRLVTAYKGVIKRLSNKDFPENADEQLKLAVEAVFKSWNNERAKAYRSIHKITGLKGTAVNVQSMVFGNMGETSGTGVAFTRNPSTGAKEFYGEYLMNAQGEDVVAGLRTPKRLETLKKIMPDAYNRLLKIKDILENHYKNMQDIEFTIEDEKLYILQTRNGKRTAQASLKIAVDMVNEKLISKEEAIMQVDPECLNRLLHPSVDPKAPKEIIAKGLPASPGAASGKVVFSAEDAVLWTNNGEKVILVRKETCPEDIQGMFSAQGILTAVGGMTSHAALVCRGMGKCCIAGASEISVDYEKKIFVTRGYTVKEGDVITINGSSGEVMEGKVAMKLPEFSKDFVIFMEWVDKIRRMKIRTNADTPKDAKAGREFGAEGIGLCRTEHMFFQKERINRVREMIVAKNPEGRKKALEKLLPMQREDFEGIFKAMDGLPVTIRLLDPPLHEFLPEDPEKIKNLASGIGISVSELKSIIGRLHEINPMLGHRGCRLGITHPEIYEMQVRAILEAGISASKKGIMTKPEIEVPLVGNVTELRHVRTLIENIIREYSSKITFPIKIGTMIELPRACLTADELAPFADFFSFGTNDLTQATFGYSRDDAGKFLPAYIEKGILERDPSESIDKKGVGELMKICVKLARGIKPELEIGICGEHGGEPGSVEFCHEIGLDYVSCSPYRVPLARLAAAQAVIKND